MKIWIDQMAFWLLNSSFSVRWDFRIKYLVKYFTDRPQGCVNIWHITQQIFSELKDFSSVTFTKDPTFIHFGDDSEVSFLPKKMQRVDFGTLSSVVTSMVSHFLCWFFCIQHFLFYFMTAENVYSPWNLFNLIQSQKT